MNNLPVREQLVRLAENRRFKSAEKLRAFLFYIVEQSLTGQSDQIKEYAIALEVYGRRPDYDSKLDSIVRVEASRLRTRLKEYYEQEGRFDPVIIELPKGSYVPTFRPGSGSTPEPAIPAKPARAPVYRIILAASGILALALTALAVSRSPRFRGEQAIATPTIAILPFNNLSLEPRNDELVKGLSKDVKSVFIRSARLKVVGTGDADFVLEASLRLEGKRIRVVAELMDRRDGSYLWSDSFERESSDSMQMQAEMAQRIGGDAESQALSAAQARAAGDTPRGKALRLYRAARLIMHPGLDGFLAHGMDNFERPSLDAVNRAIDLAEKSVAADPTFAAGYVTLATCYQLAGEYDSRMMDKAVETARRAIQIDPKLGEAHAVLGYIDYLYNWRFSEAADEFKGALEYEPRQLTTFRLYADCLTLLGRFDDATREIARARVIFPDNPVVETTSLIALYHAGRFEEMERQARLRSQAAPGYHLSHWALGLALEQLGRTEEAIHEFETCLKLSPRDGRCAPAAGHAYAKAGRVQDAERILESLRKGSRTQTHAPYEIALIQNGLGEETAAIASLQSAMDEREPGVPYLKVEPRFRNLRQSPQVGRILKQVGL